MSKKRTPYHEKLLHWIWEHQSFSTQQLQTAGQENIIIHNPGRLNHTDGPDFKDAEVTVGNLRWYGDIEIHWKLADWKAHAHHTNPDFKQVILHVIFEENEQRVYRNDGSAIPTLSISSYLEQPLQQFMDQYQQPSSLPCAGHLSFISEEAFEAQIQKAHKEYFEQKIEDLLNFYDPNLIPSMAWEKMFTIALFDGLGISHNREPMQALAKEIFTLTERCSSKDALKEIAVARSGINQDDNSSNQRPSWNHKGVRPGNHPEPRILQAAECLWYIRDLPLKSWMRDDPDKLWKTMKNQIMVSPSLGKERGSILYGTVFLPALYALGNLFFDEQLKTRSWRCWQKHQASLPKSLLKKFAQTSLPAGIYAHKLGAIHQLRKYCGPRNCQECKVFNSAISS